MRKFIRQYRKFIAISAFVLTVMLVTASMYDIWIWTGIPPSTVNQSTEDQPSVPPETTSSPRGIVLAGYVGTSVLLPINSSFAGRVSEIYVKEGQAVKAGQPLFKLEAASVQKTDESPAAPANNESSLKDYTRLQKLYEQGIISRRELENAEARQGAPQKYPSGQTTNAAPAITTAPVEGIVTALATSSGNMVQADQRILSLGSGQAFEVVVPLEQKELYLIQPGTPATIEVAGDTIMGEVASIFPEVKDNAISSFLAHINLTDPPVGLLEKGMPVNVRIDTGP